MTSAEIGGRSPSDFLRDRSLDLEEIPPQIPLLRYYRAGFSPIFYNETPEGRWNAPDGSYGTMYAGLSDKAAFAETFLRERGRGEVFESDLKTRGLALITAMRPLRLVRFFGNGLNHHGLDGGIASEEPDVDDEGRIRYPRCGVWSRAVHDHPDAPDGIMYRCRFDNDEFGVALFDRAKSRTQITRTTDGYEALRQSPHFMRCIDHYKIAIHEVG